MNRNWLALIALGMVTMSTACLQPEPTPSPEPDPTPSQPSYAPPSFVAGEQPWLAGEAHDVRVSWLDSEGSLLGCGILGLCPALVEFTVVSAECTNCVFTDPSPSATHDGDASFVVTPSAAGELQVHLIVRSTQTQQTRSIDFESTADAYRGLDVRCYVVTAATPQTATPCGATRAADDEVVFEVEAVMVSGRSRYIEPDDLARVTIAGRRAVVWNQPALQVADSETQLVDVVRAGAPLTTASVVVAWTDDAGTAVTATVAIPAISQ